MKSEYLEILNEVENKGNLLRLFLFKDEIKICNILVKMGYLCKSKTCEKNSTLSFYVTKKYYDEYC